MHINFSINLIIYKDNYVNIFQKIFFCYIIIMSVMHMRVILQRVKKASCEVDKKIVGKINKGLLILVGFTSTDTSKEIDSIIDKIINLRIFDDESGVMNRSVLDISGSLLSISQFTLYADCKKGRRPSYVKALSGDKAIKLYNEFNEKLSKTNLKTETGIFGADMKISLINDGPVTIMLEKENEDVKK